MSETAGIGQADKSESGGSSMYGSTLIQSRQTVNNKIDFCSSKPWLPIMLGIFLGLAMVVPYSMAVSQGHVEPIFPYISEAGAEPPESCIFSQFLDMAAFFAFASVYVRYKQVNEHYKDVPGIVLKLNKAAVVFGCLAALGLSLAANFQKPNINSVHLIGGALCFGGGSVYGFMQSLISYKLAPGRCSVLTCRLRLFFSILTTIFLITNLLFDELSHIESLQKHLSFAFHIVSTTSEWANTIAFMLFFLTFVREFGTIETGGVKPSHMPLVHPYEPLA